MVRSRFLSTAGALLASVAALGLAATPASAADVKYFHLPAGHANQGHAAYNRVTDHGWVCDDLSDGLQVYAEYGYWTVVDDILTVRVLVRVDAPAKNTNHCGNHYFDPYGLLPTTAKTCLNIPNGFDICGDWKPTF
jgi:hypothetical protein